MLTSSFNFKRNTNPKVLIIGAHADDIEIGCGGTILKLKELYPSIEFIWVVLSGKGARIREAKTCATAFLEKSKKTIITPEFEDGFLPYSGKDVKMFFENELKPTNPDLILTHYQKDFHQDHRITNELTWNTFRNHQVLEYEIPKYDGDISNPNFYVPLKKEYVKKKVDLLFAHFISQRSKNWFQKETFTGLMRLRGMECQVSGYAEAFYARKLIY
jgi:LmbE family N-acetylglucosaminyl deacetylase